MILYDCKTIDPQKKKKKKKKKRPFLSNEKKTKKNKKKLKSLIADMQILSVLQSSDISYRL